VIAVITENFYNSPFSMCELGGTWLHAKNFIPVLVPPVRFGDMKAVLAGLQALCIDRSADLDELRDEVAKRLEITPLSTPRWNERREEFLTALPALLRELPPSPSVPREHLERQERIVSEYKAELENARTRIEQLERLNLELGNLKDAEAVARIELKELSTVDAFDKLVTRTRKSLGALARVTRETMFAAKRGEDFHPGDASSMFSWDDAERPLQYKEVVRNAQANGICVNDEHPKVKEASLALRDLNKWLKQLAPEDFVDWYSSTNGGHSPDLEDRTFWDTHLW
jgi:hypothetical protein